ncbi:taste receptor type 1 member 3 [Myiozetetes cayanensis]|uniref:taste receptor type 1 member 3 n=1 Tax=Myiozetetes cayanensis TaxID=478635 RepID=UPI00215E5FBC|nr:taste receptor type 1 member 3 [Myiozetetes cayanensis]UTS87246.1 taste receptor type 1 member 3 [Myiozetetes cayanensis]
MVPELLLCMGLGCAGALSPTCLSAQFSRPGDYILGGLFPFGKDTVNLTARSEPTLLVCERLFLDGLVWALGMKFAIDEINNSTSLLPGVTLGYDMYDTCFEPLVALQPSLLFLTRNGTTGIGILCNSTDCQPRVTAVIGPHKSDLCLVTAKPFSSFLIPQVSYAASSEKLSNAQLYPSFYRTVPSDKNLVEAVVLLLNRFGWNWIATIASDDEYGQGAQELFLSTAGNNNICIAFEGLIPTDLSEPNAKKQLEDTINLINKTKVNIIVLFAFNLPAQALLEQSIRMGLSKKVWIGTKAWMLSDIPTSVPNIQSIGTVLGFVMKAGTVPGFQRYVADLFTSVQQDEFCQESRELSRLMNTDVLGTHCEECDHISLGDLSFLLSIIQVQPVHVAVYSVAYALHRALGCTPKACPKAPIRSWQLLQFMDTLPFEVNGQSFRFDQSHSTNTGYKLIFWSWKNGSLTNLPVGDYEQTLHIDESQIQFHTPDQKEPTSECFRHCKPGQVRRIKGFHLCCYDCTDCPENTFWSSEDSSSCSPCPQHQWAPARSTRCYERSERFLFWDEPLAIALLALMSITVLLTCLAALLFLRNLQTPLVRAAGGERTLFALLCLALLSLSCCLHVGRPSGTLCAVQGVVYALCLNGCFSTFLIKTLEITLVTEFPRRAPSLLRWVTHRRSWLLVASCLLTQGLLCLCHLHLGPAYLVPDYKSLPTEVLLVCHTRSWGAFALLHGYNSCLALVCFLGTFMVQTLGKRYNLARGITLATLIYFVVWIFFVAVFASLRTVLRAVSKVATTLMISLGILGTYYLPKCYIILFKPEMNTVDCFQNSIQEEPEEDSANRQ